MKPPDDALYAWLELGWVRVETISGTKDGDVISVLIDGVLEFYLATFNPDGYYEREDMRMKTPLESIEVTMPAPEVLYRLAKRAKDRSAAVSDGWGSDSTRESFSDHLNEIGNGYLRANGGR